MTCFHSYKQLNNNDNVYICKKCNDTKTKKEALQYDIDFNKAVYASFNDKVKQK